MHFVINPFSSILIPVFPFILSNSMHFVLIKSSIVHASISKSKDAISFSFAINIIPFVFHPVRPFFNTVSMRFSVYELPFKNTSVFSFNFSSPVQFSIFKLAFI